MTTRAKKQIRKDRWWNHVKAWLKPPFFINLQPVENYNPELWRDAFERFQTHGASSLSAEEIDGIQPLVSAQVQKEAVLTGHASEALEFWSSGMGWMPPLRDSLERGDYDRLTRVAILRMIRSLRQDALGFFQRHPGISQAAKGRAFALKAA